MRAICLIFALGLCSEAAAASDGFRCPDTSKLIRVGDSPMLVRQKCREPDDRTERYVTRREWVYVWQYGRRVRVEREVQVLVEEWLYDFGPHDFIRELRFEDGRLRYVHDGGYGKK